MPMSDVVFFPSSYKEHDFSYSISSRYASLSRLLSTLYINSDKYLFKKKKANYGITSTCFYSNSLLICWDFWLCIRGSELKTCWWEEKKSTVRCSLERKKGFWHFQIAHSVWVKVCVCAYVPYHGLAPRPGCLPFCLLRYSMLQCFRNPVQDKIKWVRKRKKRRSLLCQCFLTVSFFV